MSFYIILIDMIVFSKCDETFATWLRPQPNALPALQMFNVSVRMTMQWSEALISAIYRDGKRRHLLDLCSFKDLYKLIHIVYTCINVGNGLKMLTYTRFLWILVSVV